MSDYEKGDAVELHISVEVLEVYDNGQMEVDADGVKLLVEPDEIWGNQ